MPCSVTSRSIVSMAAAGCDDTDARLETLGRCDDFDPLRRPYFGDLRAVFPSERLAAPPALEDVPYGKGSRVALSTASPRDLVSLGQSLLAVPKAAQQLTDCQAPLVRSLAAQLDQRAPDGRRQVSRGDPRPPQHQQRLQTSRA